MVSIWVQRIWILTITAIFPRALPAAALVDVRPEVASDGAKPSVVCFVLAEGLLAAGGLFPVFGLLLDSFDSVYNRREIWNTNLGATARLVRVVDFGTSSISSSSSSSLSASTWVSRTSEAESEAQLTMCFLPEVDAFLPVAVDVAALLPLLVPAFFANGAPISEPKSLPGSSISIAIESTDPASSSPSARPLALPLVDSISIW